MIIDCHAHLVPPSLLEAIRAHASSFPSIRLIEDGGSLGFSFAGGQGYPAGFETVERFDRPPEMDGRAENRTPGGRRLARYVRL
jgi:hypothetical protein